LVRKPDVDDDDTGAIAHGQSSAKIGNWFFFFFLNLRPLLPLTTGTLEAGRGGRGQADAKISNCGRVFDQNVFFVM
jgi:hypothetical protein